MSLRIGGLLREAGLVASLAAGSLGTGGCATDHRSDIIKSTDPLPTLRRLTEEDEEYKRSKTGRENNEKLLAETLFSNEKFFFGEYAKQVPELSEKIERIIEKKIITNDHVDVDSIDDLLNTLKFLEEILDYHSRAVKRHFDEEHSHYGLGMDTFSKMMAMGIREGHLNKEEVEEIYATFVQAERGLKEIFENYLTKLFIIITNILIFFESSKVVQNELSTDEEYKKKLEEYRVKLEKYLKEMVFVLNVKVGLITKY